MGLDLGLLAFLTITLAVSICFACWVDSQLFQLFLQGPTSQGLFPVLNPLQVGLPLFVGLCRDWTTLVHHSRGVGGGRRRQKVLRIRIILIKLKNRKKLSFFKLDNFDINKKMQTKLSGRIQAAFACRACASNNSQMSKERKFVRFTDIYKVTELF